MSVLAHAGHWLSQLIYVVPVALVVAGLIWQHVRDRRHPDRRQSSEQAHEPSLDDVMDDKR